RIELGANSDTRPDAGLLRAAYDHLQLVEFLYDDDHALANLHAQQRQVNESLVFESVADQQGLGRLLERKRRIQLGLRAALDAEVVLASLSEKLLDDLTARVDLHRKYTVVPACITEFTRGV